MNRHQIRCDCSDGIPVSPKTDELRVMQVSLGLAQQDSLRQQTFPPESDQALPVQVLRMHGPDSHVYGICIVMSGRTGKSRRQSNKMDLSTRPPFCRLSDKIHVRPFPDASDAFCQPLTYRDPLLLRSGKRPSKTSVLVLSLERQIAAHHRLRVHRLGPAKGAPVHFAGASFVDTARLVIFSVQA